MATPCLVQTCSVELQMVPVLGLQADVRLSPTGMLECLGDGDDAADGVGLNAILKFDDVNPASVDECGLLGRTNLNELFASRPGYQRFNMSNSPREDIPEATPTTVSIGSIENTSDCYRLALFDTQYQVLFDVINNAGDRFYNIDIRTELFKDGVTEHDFTTNYNGITPPAASDGRVILPRRFDNMVIDPGATHVIEARVTITSGTGSLTANVDATGGDNGLLVALQGVIVDLDSTPASALLPNLATIT